MELYRGFRGQTTNSRRRHPHVPASPSRGPHTRDATDCPVPRRSCNARFGAPIWNGFLRVGQSR